MAHRRLSLARNNFNQKKLDDAVYPILESYPWHGNARELRNAIERMAVLTAGTPDTRGDSSGDSGAAAPRGAVKVRHEVAVGDASASPPFVASTR
jgi:DNA-binding NtrC family response regulator